MTTQTSWPWVAGLIAAAATLNPLGFAVINATVSGEQLARTIGTLMFAVALGVIALIALIEFGIRKYLMARQRRKNEQAASGAVNG